jgi:hypothetical protein
LDENCLRLVDFWRTCELEGDGSADDAKPLIFKYEDVLLI